MTDTQAVELRRSMLLGLLNSFLRLIIVSASLFISIAANAQVTNVASDQANPVPGVPHDYLKSLNEIVNPATGSLSVRIDIPTLPVLGPYSRAGFDYDSSGIIRVQPKTGYDLSDGYSEWGLEATLSDGLMTMGGWAHSGAMLSYRRTFINKQVVVDPPIMKTCYYATDYVFRDPSGGRHSLGVAYVYPSQPDCTSNSYNVNFSFQSILSGGDTFYKASFDSSTTSWIITGADGTTYVFYQDPYKPNFPSQGPPDPDQSWSMMRYWSPTSVHDANGNPAQPNGVTISGMGASEVIGSTAIRFVTVSGLPGSYTVTWKRIEINSQAVPWTGRAGNPSFCAGIGNVGNTMSVITDIALPNGGTYHFDYDPGFGLVSKIIYPGGGSVNYTWGWNLQSSHTTGPDSLGPDSRNFGSPDANICGYYYATPAITQRTLSFDGTATALQQDFSYSTSGWSGSNWTSKQTTITTHDLVTGTSSQVVYSYTPVTIAVPPGDSMFPNHTVPVESTTAYKDASGNTKKTIGKTWAGPDLMTCESVSLENGLTSVTSYLYGGGGVLTNKKEYDYAAGATCASPGTATRETAIDYQSFANTAILDRPAHVKVKDSGGNIVAETDYAYDDRGNATSVTKKCLQSCTDAVTTYTYNSRGQVLTVVAPNGNASGGTPAAYTTTYTYADAFPNRHPTQVTLPPVNGISQQRTFVYNDDNGLLTSSTDANNGATTSYKYNDNFNRLTEVDFPDGGIVSYSYNDATYSPTVPSPSVTTSTKIDSGKTLVRTIATDGMGQVIRTLQTSDPQGTVYSNVIYDGFGRKYKVSTPYRSTSDSTYGNTQYDYDALGRLVKLTNPDGSTAQTEYAGNVVTVTDEAQRKRQSTSNALGQLTSVTEPDASTGALTSGYVTNYTYDTLGNLQRVSQAGIADRVFSYDGLSRLLTASNPESGLTCYGSWSGGSVGAGTCQNGYDTNGNVLRKTDARGVQSSYTYDALNRVTAKTYSDSTPSACLQYDQASTSVPNSIGRLVNEWTQAGACSTQPPSSVITRHSILSYDSMGRPAQDTQCTPYNCNVTGRSSYSSTYGYDYVGNMNLFTNGIGSISFTTSQDAANRLKTVTSSWIDSTHPATLFSVSDTGYGPVGLTDASFGAGLKMHREYDSRLRPTKEIDTGYLATPAVAGAGSLTITGNEQANGTPTASTGSVTLSGSEQSKQNTTASATTASGTITVSGSLQSKQVQTAAATSGTATITFSGGDQSIRRNMCPTNPDGPCWTTIYNSGRVDVTINGTTYSASLYSVGTTAATLASNLAYSINSGSLATASVSGGTVTVTARATGASTNYAVSTSCTFNTAYFGYCAWSAYAPSTLSGGKDSANTTVYDSGTTTITVNGQGIPYSWSGSATTSSAIAQNLASLLNSSSSYVTASASGSVVTMTTRQIGASVNYSLASSSTYDSSNFSGASFSTSNSGGTLTGGKDATTGTVYDSGTAVLTVNGSTTSVPYAQGDTTSSIISKLASAVGLCGGSALVSGTASGSTLNLTSCSKGASVNYSLAASTSYDTSNFSSSSFTASTSGSTMTGGSSNQGATVYDSGTVTLTINGVAGSTTYGQGATATSVASGLASAFSGSSQVSVAASGATLTITAKTAGTVSNYSYSVTSTYDTTYFSSPSFSGVAGLLTGGKDAVSNAATVYSYAVNSYEPNGNPSSITDSIMGSWGYTYDSLNRLKQAVSTSGTYNGATLSWTYDRFGNRWSQSASGNSGVSVVQTSYSFTGNGNGNNNRIDSFNYDAAGNLLYDGGTQYTYDAEGRISTVTTSGAVRRYVYNAAGQRVAKLASDGSVLSSYVLGLNGEQVTEMDAGGNWVHSNVFVGGKLLATYDTSGLHFHANDWLGTRRAQTKYDGTLELSCQSLPFGDSLGCSGSAQDATEHHLTGKERDSETGLDYFGARYHASNMGRFMTPDPLGGKLADPQTLNRYSYVRNNPINLIDPTGMYICKDSEDCSSDQDVAFEKARQADLARGGDAARAASAYGDPNKDNHVTVDFAELDKKGEGGNATSTLGADSNGKLFAKSDVVINSKLSGTALEAAVGHEGSHVADAQDVVKSITFDTMMNFKVGQDITRYQSEQRAYKVTDSILRSANEKWNFNCGLSDCWLGTGLRAPAQLPGVVDTILANSPLYRANGQPLSPTNQGGNVANITVPK